MSRKHVPVSDRTICAYCREPWPCYMSVATDAVITMAVDIAEGRGEGAKERTLAKIGHHRPVDRH